VNRTDENGNSLSKVDTLYVLYIETQDKVQPVIKSVLYQNNEYSTSISPLSENSIFIGRHLTGAPIYIRSVKGNHLWKIKLLDPVKPIHMREKEYNRFILFCQKNLRSYTFIIRHAIELQSEESN
jgi:hypothetical protein